MNEGKRKHLIVVVVLLFVAIAGVQQVIEPIQAKMSKQASPQMGEDGKSLMVQLPGQFIVASFMGFKEVIAGSLWVRAETFFHSGQYEAIVPIVRLVTWLDPHNIDVFTTGGWHLGYNFVDSSQKSDKRYLAAATGLLKEGIRANPNRWDLYFELGWTLYNRKMEDYENAIKYIGEACKYDGVDINTGAVQPRPEFVDRMLAYMLERAGDYEGTIKQWEKARARAVRLQKAQDRTTYTGAGQSSVNVCDRNLALFYLRHAWRYGNMDYYKKGIELAENLSGEERAAVAKWALDGAKADYQRRLAAGNPPRDALKPLDTKFEITWKKIKPRVLEVRGKLNLAQWSEYEGLASEVFTHAYQKNQAMPPEKRQLWRDGCRVKWMLADYDYERTESESLIVGIDTNQTVQWDSFYVQGGSFHGKIDFSDPNDRLFYPLKAEKYKLVFWFSPQEPGCPDFVQDRIGWKGEALTDARYLDTKTQPGFRKLRVEYVLNREDIL